MKFIDLAKKLHDDRAKYLGPTPAAMPISQTIELVSECFTAESEAKFPEVMASIRQYSRGNGLPFQSLEEKAYLQHRFDYAIAICLLLTTLQEGPRGSILPEAEDTKEEDLIEWALLTCFNFECRTLNNWSIGKVLESRSQE